MIVAIPSLAVVVYVLVPTVMLTSPVAFTGNFTFIVALVLTSTTLGASNSNTVVILPTLNVAVWVALLYVLSPEYFTVTV